MRLKIAQVIGLNTDQKAAQVTSAVREEGNAFLAVLELTSDDAFTKGRQILSELEDFYFEFEGEPAEKLSATFEQVQNKLPQDGEFSLSLVAVSGKVLYLIGKGEVQVYLKRADKLSSLLSVGAPAQLISGFLQEGDRLLLSTNSLTALLGSELEKSLNLPIERFEEEVSSKIDESIKISQSLRHPESDSSDEGSYSHVSDLEHQGLAALAVEMEGEENVAVPPLSAPELSQQQYQADSPVQSTVYRDQNIVRAPVFQTILSKAAALFRLLRAYFPTSGRGRLIIAIILIAIIALGAGYQYKSSRDKQKNLQFNQLLQQSRDNFNAAKGLASLNPTDAKSKLDLVQDEVNKALTLKPQDSTAQDLKKQIEQESPSILQQFSVTDFPVFLDLDLVKKNFRAASMSLSGNKLLVLDPGVKTLVLLDLSKKSNKILAGSDTLGDAAFASLNGALAFIYSIDKGTLKIDSTNQKLTTVAKADSDFGEIKDLYSFAGNIYLLDAAKNQIWKYIATSDGYSDKREYLSKDSKADFSGALKMQIESSVYVLKSGGEILRFTRGDKDNFSLSGLPAPLKDPKSIFTSSDTDNLYVLDSGNSRLLILTKTGSYKGQISGSKFATATDVVVDEAGKKVYLLDGGKIYSVDLK